jgi:hypothetical protein
MIMLQNNNKPIDVLFSESKITVILEDGREISNPLSWFPWLEGATADQRSNFELWPLSIDWPVLNEGIDIEGILRGIKPPYPQTVEA